MKRLKRVFYKNNKNVKKFLTSGLLALHAVQTSLVRTSTKLQCMHVIFSLGPWAKLATHL